MRATVLVAGTDPEIREALRSALGRAGFATEEAGDAAATLAQMATAAPDLVVLDTGSRGGPDLCREIRRGSRVPVVVLAARGEETGRAAGLAPGADDSVPGPVSPPDVVARVEAILHRAGGASDEAGTLRRGLLGIDRVRHLAHVAGAPLALTQREIEILTQLMARPDTIVPRPRLVDAVYGLGGGVSDRTLDSHLRNLRAKLSAAGLGDAIETVHGVGVRMGACRGTVVARSRVGKLNEA